MQFLRRNWVGLMFCALGLLLVVAHPFVWYRHHAYASAPACASSGPTGDCRLHRLASVTDIHQRRDAVKVVFEVDRQEYKGSFNAKAIRDAVLEEHFIVPIEIWRHNVMAMTLGTKTYPSAATESPWWLSPLGLALVGLGIFLIRTGAAGTYVKGLPWWS